MKIAVGIIGLVCSMVAFVQSLALFGLSGVAGEEGMSNAAALGVLVAFLMFLGGACSFGAHKVARVLFFLSGVASVPARADFPDAVVWGGVSVVLCVVLLFVKSPAKE